MADKNIEEARLSNWSDSKAQEKIAGGSVSRPLTDVKPSSKKTSNGTGDGNTYITNNYNGSANAGGGANGNSYNGSGSTTIDAINNQARRKYDQAVSDNEKKVAESTKRKADARLFDNERGRTGDSYISFGTLRREKAEAERELEQAENDNKGLQALKAKRQEAKDNYSTLKKALKNGDDKLDVRQINSELAEAQRDLDYYDTLIKTYEGTDEFVNNPEYKELLKDWKGFSSNLSKKVNTLESDKQRAESYQKLMAQAKDLTPQLMDSIGLQIDSMGKLVAKEGSDVSKAQYETASALHSFLSKAWEDGRIDRDEMKQFGKIYKGIDKMIDETRHADKNIMDAETRVENAKAKSSYYLFDQIKSIAVLLVGLSQGNAQMVYSAMDNFNKKISDAEAGFQTNRINAFSNDDVKDITGEADAHYDLKQIKTILEQKIADSNLKENEKALAVKQLYNALETYKPLSKSDSDFAAWFTTQSAQGASSGWDMLLKALGAGAMNADALKELLSGGSNSNPGSGSGSDNKASVKNLFAPGAKLDNPGKGIPGGIMDGILSKGAGEEVAKLVREAEKQTKATNKLRNVQSTEMAALSSRLGAGAPQGGGTASPVNKSWGGA